MDGGRLLVGRAWIELLPALALAGCLAPDASECPGGGVCPPGLACRMDGTEQVCVPPACGNGELDPGEGCDDGNNSSGDTCEADCRSMATCGDGDVDPTEDCDDGNIVSGDGCQWNCRFPVYPPERFGHGMAYDEARSRVTMFGGAGVTLLNDTWVWDGEIWTELAPPSSPPRRSWSALAYDAGRQRVLLFGGINEMGTPVADTWEWDGTTWIERMLANRPPPRRSPAMAYDAARDRVVLFGGQGTDPMMDLTDDTWEWDGTDWLERTPATRPDHRVGHVMAYDAARARVVLFGGVGVDSFERDDTWEWDGTNWVQRWSTTTPPPPRMGSAMAYDGTREVVVLFGGSFYPATENRLNDTWEWDGGSWRDRSPSPPAASPPTRDAPALAWDPLGEQVVLFGGWAGISGSGEYINLNDTWTWDGTTWIERL